MYVGVMCCCIGWLVYFIIEILHIAQFLRNARARQVALDNVDEQNEQQNGMVEQDIRIRIGIGIGIGIRLLPFTISNNDVS